MKETGNSLLLNWKLFYFPVMRNVAALFIEHFEFSVKLHVEIFAFCSVTQTLGIGLQKRLDHGKINFAVSENETASFRKYDIWMD